MSLQQPESTSSWPPSWHLKVPTPESVRQRRYFARLISQASIKDCPNSLNTDFSDIFVPPHRRLINGSSAHRTTHLYEQSAFGLRDQVALPRERQFQHHPDMNYQQLEDQPSGYDDAANTALGLDIAQYEDEVSSVMPASNLGSNVDLHGGLFSSQYTVQSGGYNVSELSTQPQLNLLTYGPQSADMGRRHSDFYPMSEGTMSPQYFSFALNQEPTPFKLDGNKAGPFSAATQGLMKQHQQRPSVRRFDSLPGTLVEEREHESYSSPESMESYLRSPITPMHDYMRGPSTNSAVPQARKKRNKCTPEQSRQLEAFFATNRNPTGRIREELSRRIQMPERSVQVWFQNKRAKTKINEIKDGVPPEQRTTVSRERFTRSISAQEITPAKKRRNTHDGINKEDSALIPLPSSSLCIGEWRRIKPLICLFSQRNQSFTWYLSSESVGFKLECPLSSVTKITFSGPTEPTIHEYSEGVVDLQGHLTLELSRPPQFYMEVFRSSAKAHEMEVGGHKAAWRQCTDFTEGRQATSTLRHTVSGSYEALRQAVTQLHESSGKASGLIEIQENEQPSVDPLQAYNLSTSTSGFFSPTSQQLNFGDFEGQHQQQSQMAPVSLSQPSQSMIRSVPNTGNSLDFTGLKIDSARQDSFPIDQQIQRPHSSDQFQSFSWMSQLQQQQPNLRQQELDPLAVSWGIGEQDQDLSSFTAMSAPAYEVRSFAEQQQQQMPPLSAQEQQFHRASIANVYPSLTSSFAADLYTPQGDPTDESR